jgi:Spy/CpxP family protein refolding chaperone
MKRLNVVMLAASLLLGAPAALAEGRGGGPGGEGFGEMHGMRMLLHAAHLTPDQKNQVHELMKSVRMQNRDTFKQLRALREQIADKLASTASVNATDLAPLQTQITQLRGQLAQQSIKTALQIRALLTPDQLSRVADLHVKMKALHEQERELFQGERDADEGAGAPDEK